jgi:tetratricopeptide (TPR) repeat protein
LISLNRNLDRGSNLEKTSVAKQRNGEFRKLIRTLPGKESQVLTCFIQANQTKVLLILLVTLFLFSCCLIFAQGHTLEEGKRLFDEEKYEEAKEVLLKVVEQEPKNAEVNFLLCKVYFMLEDHDNSIKYGEKAIELDDSQSDYHLWLGGAHGMQAEKGSKLKAIFRARRAKKDFERAIELDSTNLRARFSLMQYCIMAPGIAGGDKDEGKRQAEIMQGLDPFFGARAWAAFWQAEEDFDKAETYLRKAVELDTSSGYWATYELGYFLQQRERHHEAVELFEKLYTQYPDQTGALYQIGRACLLAEDSLDKAERCFRQYLQIKPKGNHPDWAAAHWRLGMVYDLQGKTDLAIAELEEAVRLAPKKKDYQKTLKEVKKKK